MIRTMQVKAPTAEYMTGTVAAASALLLDNTKELGNRRGIRKDKRSE